MLFESQTSTLSARTCCVSSMGASESSEKPSVEKKSRLESKNLLCALNFNHKKVIFSQTSDAVTRRRAKLFRRFCPSELGSNSVAVSFFSADVKPRVTELTNQPARHPQFIWITAPICLADFHFARSAVSIEAHGELVESTRSNTQFSLANLI